MNNLEYEAQKELRKFFDKALTLQLEKAKKYGESWQLGRPTGVTDNLYWIITRVKNMERVLCEVNIESGFIDRHDENSIDGIEMMSDDLYKKIEDDLLDLVNFAGFRWVMNNDRRDLV